MEEGKCIIISAPSGAGKTTIVHHLLQQFPELEFSISACTREKRDNETDGKDYHFLSLEDFNDNIDKGVFVEWEEVYPGQRYGTMRSEIHRVWAKGNIVIFDVDVLGALNLKKIFDVQALAVFIMPPSIDELASRLRSRAAEPPEKIEMRVKKAAEEMKYSPKFDKVVVNDGLPHAFADAVNLVTLFLES